MEEDRIAIFQGKQIRKILYHGEWWFSVIDAVAVLADSSIPRRYWSDLKIKIKSEGYAELYEKIVQLKLTSTDGKKYVTDCANTETMFRIIESIPSPKAEPLKRWLARVGYERIQEIENPELAQERMKALYAAKGYSQDWIDKRLRGIAIRQGLTDEWKKRGIHSDQDYAILTAEISKATFGVTPSEYKKLKGLKRENLRDHMTDLELIFTMLGERVTTEISEQEKPENFAKSKSVSKNNFLVKPESQKKLK